MTSNFIQDLAAEAVELCASLAALDFRGMPVYVVPLSSLDTPPAEPDCRLIACTSVSMDLELQRQIPNWRGRGFCCVIDDRRLLSAGHSSQVIRWKFLGAAVHEMGHAMTFDKAWYVGGRELRHYIRANAAERKRSKRALPDPAAPWAGHEAQWIRAALHLCHRANMLHAPIDGELSGVAGRNYGLSDPAKYAAALGGERFALDGLPIRDVLAARPPAAFEALWTSDTSRRI